MFPRSASPEPWMTLRTPLVEVTSATKGKGEGEREMVRGGGRRTYVAALVTPFRGLLSSDITTLKMLCSRLDLDLDDVEFERRSSYVLAEEDEIDPDES